MERNENWNRAKTSVIEELDRLNTPQLRGLSRALGYVRRWGSINNFIESGALAIARSDKEVRKANRARLA